MRKPRRLTRRAFDAFGVRDAPPQHLIAAANAQDMSAAPQMGGKVDVPTLSAQKGQIATGRFGSRQNDQPRITRNGLPRAHHDKIDARLGLQGIKIVKVRNAREGQAGDSNAIPAWTRGNVQGIFCRQKMSFREPGQDAKSTPARVGFDQPIAVIEKSGVAAEFVDEKSRHHRGVIRVDHRLCSDHLRNDPASVYIACQYHRDIGGACKAHIGNVTPSQIDLGRTARALHDYQIMHRLQSLKALLHGPHQLRLEGGVIARARSGQPFAMNYYLRANVGFRLQQHWIHIGHRLKPTSKGL